MVTQTIKGLLALTILSVTSIDAKIWGGIRPSLLKRKLNYSRRNQQQDITTHIPTGNANTNDDHIEKAVFCVRGGGANGPCIGIDLGKCAFALFFGWLCEY